MAVAARLAAALLLAGCTGTLSGQSTADPQATPGDTTGDTTGATRTPYAHYVALGDSFTAGPYVPTTDLANGCLRSNGNYPSLLAARLGIADFSDASCSAARIRDLRRPQGTFRDTKVAAQFDALTRQTDLVTISIGGNDFNLFGNLLQTCAVLRLVDPSGAPCTDHLESEGIDLEAQIRRIGDRTRHAISTVQRRSPDARILVVGYPRITPANAYCPRLLPLAKGDYATADRAARSLHLAMRGAATSTGVGYVDMWTASRGHDVCSRDPWVNGRVTDKQAALAFHPFADGMRAVATRIVARLE